MWQLSSGAPNYYASQFSRKHFCIIRRGSTTARELIRIYGNYGIFYDDCNAKTLLYAATCSISPSPSRSFIFLSFFALIALSRSFVLFIYQTESILKHFCNRHRCTELPLIEFHWGERNPIKCAVHNEFRFCRFERIIKLNFDGVIGAWLNHKMMIGLVAVLDMQIARPRKRFHDKFCYSVSLFSSDPM